MPITESRWLQLAAALLCLACAAAGDAAPPHVVMISGSGEYKSEPSLTAFKPWLEERKLATVTLILGKDGGKDLKGLEALDQADVMLVFLRRNVLPEDQQKRIKDFCAAGKGVIGLRTASHAFNSWPEFDAAILGGSYSGHGGPEDMTMTIHDAGKDHPVLRGFATYAVKQEKVYNQKTGIAKDATPLLMTKGKKEEFTAWARTVDKTRVFYTWLGYPQDFAEPQFRRLMANAIHWAAGREVPAGGLGGD